MLGALVWGPAPLPAIAQQAITSQTQVSLECVCIEDLLVLKRWGAPHPPPPPPPPPPLGVLETECKWRRALHKSLCVLLRARWTAALYVGTTVLG